MFDSGFGGLTVARAVIDLLPHERLVYLGDTGRYPYGPRPLAEVRAYAVQIGRWLVEEHGVRVFERQVCRYVHECQRELGLVGEVFVLQLCSPGAEVEVDWFEVLVIIVGVAMIVHLFVLWACYSGVEFVMAFMREIQ